MDAQVDFIRVFAYTSLDDRIFAYRFTEEELQETISIFNAHDIWFTLTDEEVAEYLGEVDQQDNLKKDFVWFRPSVGGRHVMECTCGNFIESGKNIDKLAKLAVRHARKTGHSLNPRGN